MDKIDKLNKAIEKRCSNSVAKKCKLYFLWQINLSKMYTFLSVSNNRMILKHTLINYYRELINYHKDGGVIKILCI